MSISYLKEKDAWSMKEITEDEKEVLLASGTEYLSMMIGGAILNQATAQGELEKLEPPTDTEN